MRVGMPLADLRRAPDGARDRQLLMGDAVTQFEAHDGHAFVQSAKDGYVGFLPVSDLIPDHPVTHWVSVPATHAYDEPDIKARDAHGLSMGAQVQVVAHVPKFYETASGHFIPKPALRPVDWAFTDHTTVAQMFFGAPYLWGGNSIAGIDCSGLVQAACLASRVPCPGDSDQQEATLGEALADDIPTARGDLIFWRGHVAVAVDADTLIHANAFSMSVAYEPIARAMHRIEAQGDGPVTSRRRINTDVSLSVSQPHG